ncbi:serine hydrolase domain-containing protein [Shimia sp. MMG029]|uniref:serine hydrolase domain-containing protein n=1 Tax=Shimia sp. MMG029 TaxID=3021978 RepID=UPI0022FED48D|nr:serine hydrolase domain-containing protein [Shimia sp. MMG029]MDA5558309.1 serine hydrolase [Shimia sp. MMG029]
MSSENFDRILKDAVAAQDVPFVVAMSANADGVTYCGSSGEAAAGRPATEDTVFRIFSATKAIGSVAAMILIDRGKLSMDTPVADILPEWDRLQVLERWDGDTPVMRAPKTTATIRHLATHRSGLEYEFWNPNVGRYLEATGHPSILSGTKAALSYPLMYDPGARWGYGPGIDWLGQVVETLDGRRIDQFCHEEIFAPLGMTDTAFEPEAFADRLSEVRARNENGNFVPFELAPPPKPEVYGMGHCLYSTAADYMKFLRMFLNKGTLDGHRILSERAFAEMLEDQMEGKTFQKMVTVAPPVTADVELPEGTTHSFAAVRFEADVSGRRKAGSQSWAGVCNTHYWVDPASDVAGLVFTQSLPFVEARYLRTYEAFEAAVYAP